MIKHCSRSASFSRCAFCKDIRGTNLPGHRYSRGRTGFRAIAGKRVGFSHTPAGVNRDGISSIDVLRNAPNVKLVALFGPEHGIYGNEKANVPVDDKIDPRTGLPVYSLYGKFRKPTPKMLKGFDALVVDLQDVGVRSYTYVSCMRYAMEACFEQGVEVIVLDRPNPLGGLKGRWSPSRQRMEKLRWRISCALCPWPDNRRTCTNREEHTPAGWRQQMTVRKRWKLTVIPMRGWKRDMLWPDTGLKWVPTSPYIPDLSAVLGYAMTGLGAQEGGFSHGIGTPYPFRLLRHKGKTPAQVKHAGGSEDSGT